MRIKNFFDKTTNFLLNRISELIGITLLCLSILLLISLISYSPEDPNFIFPDNAEIKNILGTRGSYVSDIFYQSIGLISLLIPISFFFISLKTIINKKISQILECSFFIILYSILGTLFFTVFHTNAYWLTINGNNGFVGNLFEETFLITLINFNHKISYTILIILIISVFLLSIKFKLKYLKIILVIFLKSNKESPKSMVSDFKENMTSETNYLNNETRIQENFSFDKDMLTNNKLPIKYKLPALSFLKAPTKKDKNSSENKIDEKVLEKILLDFGVEGEIKR